MRLWRAKYKALGPALTERGRRIWAATEARAAGRGGISGVARATGIAYSTIGRGLKELESGASAARGACGARAAVGSAPWTRIRP